MGAAGRSMASYGVSDFGGGGQAQSRRLSLSPRARGRVASAAVDPPLPDRGGWPPSRSPRWRSADGLPAGRRARPSRSGRCSRRWRSASVARRAGGRAGGGGEGLLVSWRWRAGASSTPTSWPRSPREGAKSGGAWVPPAPGLDEVMDGILHRGGLPGFGLPRTLIAVDARLPRSSARCRARRACRRARGAAGTLEGVVSAGARGDGRPDARGASGIMGYYPGARASTTGAPRRRLDDPPNLLPAWVPRKVAGALRVCGCGRARHLRLVFAMGTRPVIFPVLPTMLPVSGYASRVSCATRSPSTTSASAAASRSRPPAPTRAPDSLVKSKRFAAVPPPWTAQRRRETQDAPTVRRLSVTDALKGDHTPREPTTHPGAPASRVAALAARPPRWGRAASRATSASRARVASRRAPTSSATCGPGAGHQMRRLPHAGRAGRGPRRPLHPALPASFPDFADANLRA